MITSLRLVNFKNFADETLRVGPFTVIVGANASGKSNIRDAFRFLHGIGRGYTLGEILGGKYGAGGNLEWNWIRGAMTEIVRFGPDSAFEPSAFSIHVELVLNSRRTVYSIKIGFDPGSGAPYVLEEELRVESELIYTTAQTRDPGLWLHFGENKERLVGFGRSQPALSQIYQIDRALWYQFISGINLQEFFYAMHFFELAPDLIRHPSFPGQNALGNYGDNLPTVLEEVCAEPTRKAVLVSWLRELTPMDVKDFQFDRDPSGRVYLSIRERNGRTVSAYSASDGTLRFLAVLAALLGANPAGVYFFEEIDNGIHPNRLWLLLDLIERQTAKGEVQVITTTHSPDVLNFINDTTFEHTSVVSRLEDTDDAIIRPLDSLPNAKKLRKSQGLGRLLAGGWMETALEFTEGYNEEADGD